MIVDVGSNGDMRIADDHVLRATAARQAARLTCVVAVHPFTTRHGATRRAPRNQRAGVRRSTRTALAPPDAPPEPPQHDTRTLKLAALELRGLLLCLLCVDLAHIGKVWTAIVYVARVLARAGPETRTPAVGAAGAQRSTESGV